MLSAATTAAACLLLLPWQHVLAADTIRQADAQSDAVKPFMEKVCRPGLDSSSECYAELQRGGPRVATFGVGKIPDEPSPTGADADRCDTVPIAENVLPVACA